MFDAFRGYESWLNEDGSLNQEITTFWTFGSPDSSGTYIMTVLGCVLMVVSIVYWVWLENKKLNAQAERLKAAGMGR